MKKTTVISRIPSTWIYRCEECQSIRVDIHTKGENRFRVLVKPEELKKISEIEYELWLSDETYTVIYDEYPGRHEIWGVAPDEIKKLADITTKKFWERTTKDLWNAIMKPE